MNMKYRAIVLPLLALVFSLGIASIYIEQSQAETALKLEVAIAEQSQTLSTLAELTAQNRADSIAEEIIRDCSPDSRARYESLLNRLAQLNPSELREADQLFDACAGFFAERKAVMVARLQREFEIYQSYIELYSELEPDNVHSYPVEEWSSLVELERERGALLSEQVAIQGNIISELQQPARDTDTIESLLVRAQQVADRAAELNRSITRAREALYRI